MPFVLFSISTVNSQDCALSSHFNLGEKMAAIILFETFTVLYRFRELLHLALDDEALQ